MTALRVKISESAGFCWGVERALELAQRAADEAPGPVWSLGPLIHNPGVIADLEKRGVNVISEAGQALKGTVILRSHGVPREVKEELAGTDTVVVDATCTFVKSAQEKAAKLQRQGYFVIILGETDHPEVLALRSYAGPDSLVVESPADLPARAPQPEGGGRRADHPVAGASRRVGGEPGAAHPRVAGAQHHLQRHRAAADRRHGHGRSGRRSGRRGGRNSGNTRRLAELCAARQPKTYHVESADELEPAWFQGLKVVGVTAGASTPPEQIKAVADRLAGFES